VDRPHNSWEDAAMTLGPLEYLVLGFTETEFDGSIAREIEKVVERGIIRLVDVVAVSKDGSGTTLVAELDRKDDPRFASFAGLLKDRMALFTEEDLESIADSLAPGTAALALLFEHRWAEDIKAAIQSRGGVLVARAVIPPEVLEEVQAELDDREPVSAG
jgi:uncharacterized membrane protein